MTDKKLRNILSALLLCITVLWGILPHACGAVYGSGTAEPVVGESYYLAADVAGTLRYFRHGTVTDTTPYSLVTTTNIHHNWAFKLTLESSTETNEKFQGGFQLTYTNPTSDTLTRIYCYDAKTDGENKGVMDTGVNSGTAYKNRHSFRMDEVNGVPVLRKYGNDNILVVKQLEQNGKTVPAWRMLGVPEAELANEGVYPVRLLTEAQCRESFADADGTTYTDLQAAANVAAGKKNKIVKLNGDVTGDFTVSRDVYLDLDGKTLTGSITLTNGARLYGMDTSADDYGKPAGKICGDISGGSAEKVFRDENTKKRYVAVQVTENGRSCWTFNRFYIGMDAVRIYLDSGDAGYKAVVGGNENVKAALAEDAYGFRVWVDGYEALAQVCSRTESDFTAGSDMTVSLRIRNQLACINELYMSGQTEAAETLQDKNIMAQATVRFADGTTVESLPYAFSVVEMYQAADAGAFTEQQQESLIDLVNKYPVMETWGLTNIMKLVETDRNTPPLAKFTVVANSENKDNAEALAAAIYEKYGICLPVVQSEDFEGNKGIYLDTRGENNYGGCKYSVYSTKETGAPGICINGTGTALDTAITKWLESVQDTSAFPFGSEERIVGYVWDTEEVGKTDLGYALQSAESRELYHGVELRKLDYVSADSGKITGYAVILSADADAELKVTAGEWDGNTTSENPAVNHTVEQYGERLKQDGFDVLAIVNGGFFDRTTEKTQKPWGLQVVDGTVRREPSADNPGNTDNWFARTADGKFVISDTAGYFGTYKNTLMQGVGGGRVLMREGKPLFTASETDYRTAVGVTKNGELILLTVPGANYTLVTRIFMDMDMDVENILNLDGGGSTTAHAADENGKLVRLICKTEQEREVADAIAIVKKK